MCYGNFCFAYAETVVLSPLCQVPQLLHVLMITGDKVYNGSIVSMFRCWVHSGDTHCCDNVKNLICYYRVFTQRPESNQFVGQDGVQRKRNLTYVKCIIDKFVGTTGKLELVPWIFLGTPTQTLQANANQRGLKRFFLTSNIKRFWLKCLKKLKQNH